MKKRFGKMVLSAVAGLLCACVLVTCDPLGIKNTIIGAATVEPVWTYSQKLTATTDAVENAQFGYSVSISSDYAIVGANRENSYNGAAYIIKRNGSTWSKLKRITPTVALVGSRFGCSVGIDGSYAIVGAYNGDRAYIFYKDQGGIDNWGQVIEITGTLSSYFGFSVAIKGNHCIIGAPYDVFTDSQSTDAQGVAHIYFRNPSGGAGGWGWVGAVIDSNGTTNDQLGNSVSISENYAIAGSPDGNSGIGIAVIFQKVDDATWTLSSNLSASNGVSGDDFGKAVSITDLYAAIGDPTKQCVYCYTRSGSSWGNEKQLLINPLPQTGDKYGWSVALSNNLILVGAYGVNTSRGACYGFENDSGDWLVGKNNPILDPNNADNDYFGWGVSINGTTCLIGSAADSSVLSFAGSAYIFIR